MSLYLRKYTNDASRFMVIHESLVHYRDEGQGPAILLLHGSFSSLHTFDGWADALRDRFRIIRLDLPGFGLSGTNPDHQYTVARYIEVLEILVNRLGITKMAIGGNSLGGWLAWEYALLHPDQVERLILISAAGFLDDKSIPLPFKMARAPVVNRIVKFVITRNLVEVFLKQVYGNPEQVTSQLVDRYFDLFSREGNPEAFIALVNGRHVDHTARLPRLQMPTLIMWGDRDEWQPIDNAYRFLKAIPASEMIIYEGLGHVCMEENPRLTAEDLAQFMTEKPVSQPGKAAHKTARKTGIPLA